MPLPDVTVWFPKRLAWITHVSPADQKRATDTMSKQSCDQEPIYDEIIRTAVFMVKPDNIATFLGKLVTYNCKKEIATKYNQLKVLSFSWLYLVAISFLQL